MIPVMQTDLTREGGNCFSACLASMLEISIDEVPTFKTDDAGYWWDKVQEWLATRGYFGIDVGLSGQPIQLSALPHGVVAILSGQSFVYPDRHHSIIGQVIRSEKHPEIIMWKYLHDPNPSGKMIDGQPTTITFIGSLELHK
jgi:hypothetical protein